MKPRINSKNRPSFSSLVKSPFWVFASIGVLLASLISFIYIRLKRSKPQTPSENFTASQPRESRQAGQDVDINQGNVTRAQTLNPSSVQMKQPLPSLAFTEQQDVPSFGASVPVPRKPNPKINPLYIL